MSNTSCRKNKVIIVDENTGRSHDGPRWSDGLHQAVEAKEEVAHRALKPQNPRDHYHPKLFSLYKKLAA